MLHILPKKDEVAKASSVEVDWEERGCLMCESRDCRPLLEARDFEPRSEGLWFAVVQCQDCGLCFTNPRPSRQAMHHFYPTNYPPHDYTDKHKPGRIRSTGSWEKPHDARKALPWHGQGRLLDFGCGGGSFLDRSRQQGWKVTGIDVSAATIERVRDRLGVEALQGSLPHALLKPESFDVITMWQALEYVHEPLETLREAHKLLVPGGKLLVAAPNIESLQFRWFREHSFLLDLPRRLTHFSPRTLPRMLEQAGFTVTSVQTLPHTKSLRESARRAASAPRISVWKRWLVEKYAARLASWYGFLINRADCLQVIAEK